MTNDVKMDIELKTRWLTALRSGEYQQGRGYLCRANPITQVTAYCCLGVLAAIEPSIAAKVPAYGRNSPVATDTEQLLTESTCLSVVAGLDFEVQSLLASMNDEDKCSFDSIADYIEDHV